MTARKNAAIVAVGLIGFLLFILIIAINILAIAFAVINGLALFGPDGDITSIWHWFWFVLCCFVILNAIVSSIGSVTKR